MVDFNAYYNSNYGRYFGVGPSYASYDYLLQEMSNKNKGIFENKNSETTSKKAAVTDAIKTGAKVGLCVAVGAGLYLAIRGKGKQALDLLKKPFQNIKIPECISKIFKKAPAVIK